MVPPLENTWKAMHERSLTVCPSCRFEERTWHKKSGLVFTLAAIIPSLPPIMMFGNVDSEDTNIAMIRCVIKHQLWEQNGATSPPGHVYHPTAG